MMPQLGLCKTWSVKDEWDTVEFYVCTVHTRGVEILSCSIFCYEGDCDKGIEVSSTFHQTDPQLYSIIPFVVLKILDLIELHQITIRE